ncbi:DUF3052 domain-containing protein [Candidatus Saccharibacteria bacterium]|nr:DUF3052 domain-containing protein [Candidatus Saccharibacteria bacterium]
MAGYSTRSLRDKLGLKSGMRAALVRLPEAVKTELGELDDVKPLKQVGGVPFDFILTFISSVEQLEAVLPNLKLHLKSDGQLWLAWAKRTSPLHSGIDENLIRRHGLAVGLVDVKVAALTSDWSGLKFVYRVSDR